MFSIQLRNPCYNPQTWVNRVDTSTADLLTKLQGQTRLLWITGMSGIGKTTLGECLASQAWESSPSFQWIYLEVEESRPNFTSIATNLLHKLGDRDLNAQELNDPEQLAKRLLQKLKSHPYWIQLDSLDRLLNPKQPTKFDDPYWAAFLQLCLTESNIVSRLVLTSQAFPTALVEFGDRYPNTWAEIRLSGLSQVDQQLEFFAKRGIVVEPTNQDILAYIAKTYEGHPLVLKVIAEDIKEFPGGVDGYWKKYQPEFEQVARKLQATRLDEMDYNEALDRQVRERIKKSLEQLPVDALDLLCRSAVFRRPVPKKFWLAMIGNCTIQQQKVAYRVLGDRALIEREGIHQGQFLIRQHNLIRDVAYDLLKADNPIWDSAERQAAHLWLTAYEPAPDASNLETVRGYLEAFNHYCELESWESAREILFIHLNSPFEELHKRLYFWGYYREQTNLYERLLYKLGERADAIFLINLSASYHVFGKTQKAVVSTKQALKIWRNLREIKAEGAALCHLGIFYASLGKYDEAVNYYQNCLVIARQSEDRELEANTLGNLGNIYRVMRNFSDSLSHHKACLRISKELKKRQMEGNALCNLGNTYGDMSDYEKAYDFFDQSLIIAREVGDQRCEANTLGGLSYSCKNLGRYSESIQYGRQHLKKAIEIEDCKGIGTALGNLGTTLTDLGRFLKAKEALEKALNIFGKINAHPAEAQTLLDLAELHQKLGSRDVALRYCQQALALATELGIPLAAECEALQLDIENGGKESDRKEGN